MIMKTFLHNLDNPIKTTSVVTGAVLKLHKLEPLTWAWDCMVFNIESIRDLDFSVFWPCHVAGGMQDI